MNSILESPAYQEFSSQFIHSQPVSISRQNHEQIQAAIRGFWDLASSDEYQKNILGKSGSDFMSAPVMGYDFHLAPDGPKLIEINTNAAGFLMLGPQLRFWNKPGSFSEKLAEIFKTESGTRSPILIADENPPAQFYYLEFEILKEILISHRFNARIADTTHTEQYPPGAFVYWRNTDFLLENFPQLKAAHDQTRIKVSPSPEMFLLLSDKMNLARWNKNIPQNLKNFILPAQPVNAQNAAVLWMNRKDSVFKPLQRFGGKGVYVGKKLTTGKWDEIKNSGNYLAQQFLAPLEATGVKYDFRAYSWRDELLMLVARGYSGQITNFRTPGGGFYPVTIV